MMATEDDSDEDSSNKEGNDSPKVIRNYSSSQNAVKSTRVGTAGWRRVSTYDMQYHQVILIFIKKFTTRGI